ncbi:MAG TPA: GNAT family N-acetyltransferase [Vicinamibacterales bacterium]|nr:GNAT family N-acetyltransferase [Vicinamibacterales bacterium]
MDVVLAADLPDIPRWIETRAMLRSGHATVFGGASAIDGYAVRVVHGAFSVVSVVGRPPASAIVAALDGVTPMTPILAQVDNTEYVERILLEDAPNDFRGWHRERVIVYSMTSFPDPSPLDPSTTVRLLTERDDLSHLPAGLRFEISHAIHVTPVGAALVDGVPVSFCYACWTTESLWDVSVDTLAAYRRRGLAPHVVRFMVTHHGKDGREPVWGALESNGLSIRLAERLGFTPVDELYAFSRGPWAYLTNGYVG